MSIRFPDTAADDATGTSYRLALPSGVASKPAATGFVALFWIRTRNAYALNASRNIVSRGGGAAAGSDGKIFLNTITATISAELRNGGSNFLAGLTSPWSPSTTYLVMVIVNPTVRHLVLCEPGQEPLPVVSSANSNNPYANGFGGTNIFDAIGGGAGSGAYYGPFEEFCMWHGCFPDDPLVAGKPDPALVRAIADGAQDLDTLHTRLITGGSATPVSRRFRYRLRDAGDLADAFGLAGDLTVVNENIPVGRLAYAAGPLRPAALRPDVVADGVSQVIFGTPGQAGTAFATVLTEGGSYRGITPAAIQARLRNEAGAVVRDWTTVDAAPAAGTWAVGALTGVPLTAGWLRLDFRAVDAAGTALADPVGSHGLKAAGFHAVTSAQSQLMFLYEQAFSGLALPVGLRGLVQRVSGSDADRSFASTVLTAASDPERAAMRGIRQAMIEINARFPGVPVALNTVGHPGTSIVQFFESDTLVGEHAWRWAHLRDRLGLVQPFYTLLMGHSTGANSNYQTNLGRLCDWSVANLGTPIRFLHCPVPRYKGAGTISPGNNADDCRWSRKGARAHVEASPAVNAWMGSWSSIEVPNELGGGTNPHPASTDAGMGRSGGMIGWALMSACRAVADRPLGIARVRAEGADALIEFAPIG